MNKKDNFGTRLTEAMNIRGLRPRDLVNMTGLSKSLISQYQSGLFEAKSDKLYLLSNALNVDIGWLMGYDVPMEKETAEHLRLREEIKDRILNLDDSKLIKVLQYIEDIS